MPILGVGVWLLKRLLQASLNNPDLTSVRSCPVTCLEKYVEMNAPRHHSKEIEARTYIKKSFKKVKT